MEKAKHPLKAYRERTGIALSDLADRAKTSRQSLFRIENWKQTPSLGLIERIVRATGSAVTANDFLPGINEEKKTDAA